MHFLHTDAEKAAAALCEQDVSPAIALGVDALKRRHESNLIAESKLDEWLEEDGLNYHWLGYFAERLNARLPTAQKHNKFYSEIMSLRRAVPTRLRCVKMTPFPLLVTSREIQPHFNEHDLDFTSIMRVAAYRADYVLSRHGYAEWKTSEPPAWFLRLANTLLPERERSTFLLRVQPAGPHGADDERSSESKRKAVRDGPTGEIIGDSGDKFSLW